MNGMQGGMVFSGHMCFLSFTGILTAVIFILDSPESNVKIADTNIYLRILASVAISARPAIRNELLNSVVAIHTFGEFQNQNPHLHIITTDGCFNDAGYFMVGTMPDAKDLEHAFRQEVFKFLKNLQRRSPDLSKMRGRNENHRLYRRGLADPQNTHASEPLGNKKS